MSTATNVGLFAALRRFTANLRYPQLFALVATLFVVDLAVPDVVPFIDEILLGLLTLLLARLKDRRGEKGEEPRLKDVTPGRS
ncbi:MAG TPA: DUF6116 family protein [Thermoanaerobaculia bacterium]|nr:DUF6116 family protein [Thermoanaerobaculia bacterium]